MFSKSHASYSFWWRNIEKNHLLLCVQLVAVSRHPLMGVFSSPLALGGGLAGELPSEMLPLCCAPALAACPSRNLQARGFGSSIFHSSLPRGTSVVYAMIPHAAISLLPLSFYPGGPPRIRVSQELWDLDKLVSAVNSIRSYWHLPPPRITPLNTHR